MEVATLVQAGPAGGFGVGEIERRGTGSKIGCKEIHENKMFMAPLVPSTNKL